MEKLLSRLFIKNYENTEDPKVREGYGKLAGAVGIVSNLLLCCVKITVGAFAGSIAIIADGINNLTDATSSVMTLVGFKLASMPEDKDHPYGHARIEYLTGVFISVFIIVAGILLLKTSAERIFTPAELSADMLTLFLLFAAILVKAYQALFNHKVGQKINSLTLTATAIDSRNDVISTSAVLASISIEKLTGFRTDGYTGCLVAAFIIWSGIKLIRETSGPLLGEAPDTELVEKIRTIALKDEKHILGVHDLIVHNYGPGKVFASIHIEVDAHGDLMKSHDIVDNVERNIKETLGIEFVAHMDPIVTDDPLVDRIKKIICDRFEEIPGIDSIHDFRIVPGHTHSKIVFDVVTTYDCKLSEKEITHIADTAMEGEERKYYSVITFDKEYANF